jgi:IclR family acetate operon transcriptional repressor
LAAPASQTLDKALTLLSVILADHGGSTLGILAKEIGLPLSTAHRLVATLERRGMIQRATRGRYLPGPALLATTRGLDEGRVIAGLSRPFLSGLAHRLRQTVHLGVLDDGMVTYLAKESHGTAALFTREGQQLEAYCSGVGKVLLAYLPDEPRERYLADGPFVALTQKTIIDPARLREHLAMVRGRGWAVDDREVSENLKCVAAPLRRPDGSVAAAISVSAPSDLPGTFYAKALAALLDMIAQLEARGAKPSGPPVSDHALVS